MKNNYLQLVNRDHPLATENYPKHLVLAPFSEEEIYLQPEAAKQFQKLLTDLKLTEKIIVLDGYRTEKQQEKLWNFSVATYGLKYTTEFVAAPGCSEHHTGLALDIGLKGTEHDLIAPTFQNDPAVTLFLENMPQYGFILRYPQDKKAETGIGYEPWHFRYVGVPHSQIMTNQNWCLEEYHNFLLETGRSIA